MSAVQQSQQPGADSAQATSNNNDNNDKNDNTGNNNNNNPTNDDNKANDDSPPKMDIVVTLKGVSEFNQFPFNKESNKFLFMAGVKAPFFRPKDRAAIDLCWYVV